MISCGEVDTDTFCEVGQRGQQTVLIKGKFKIGRVFIKTLGGYK